MDLYDQAKKLYDKMLEDYKNESSLLDGKKKCESRIEEIKTAKKERKNSEITKTMMNRRYRMSLKLESKIK